MMQRQTGNSRFHSCLLTHRSSYFDRLYLIDLEFALQRNQQPAAGPAWFSRRESARRNTHQYMDYSKHCHLLSQNREVHCAFVVIIKIP